jgi:hypothetical protein
MTQVKMTQEEVAPALGGLFYVIVLLILGVISH